MTCATGAPHAFRSAGTRMCSQLSPTAKFRGFKLHQQPGTVEIVDARIPDPIVRGLLEGGHGRVGAVNDH